MRFPETFVAPAGPAGTTTQLAPVVPVPAAPAVAANAAPALGLPEPATATHERSPADSPAQAGGEADHERFGEDRRKMCRRIYHLPVLLDTRSGSDRRGATRRDADPLTHIDRDA